MTSGSKTSAVLQFSSLQMVLLLVPFGVHGRPLPAAVRQKMTASQLQTAAATAADAAEQVFDLDHALHSSARLLRDTTLSSGSGSHNSGDGNAGSTTGDSPSMLVQDSNGLMVGTGLKLGTSSDGSIYSYSGSTTTTVSGTPPAATTAGTSSGETTGEATPATTGTAAGAAATAPTASTGSTTSTTSAMATPSSEVSGEGALTPAAPSSPSSPTNSPTPPVADSSALSPAAEPAVAPGPDPSGTPTGAAAATPL